MKFLHLQVGQQFEFRGDHYTKIAPLIASNNANGRQKMIPRSAAVTVQGDDTATSKAEPNKPHAALEVVERYHQTALAELQSLSEDEAKLGAARARLDSLKSELKKAIEQA
jgi:hypothetical protein